MPTYDYACDWCGHRFEAVQKMADAPLETCPECGKKIRRVLSGGIGISFKGSGFYVNDASSGSSAATSKPAKTESVKSTPSTACASCPSKASGTIKGKAE